MIELLSGDALGEGMWYDVGRYTQLFIGGMVLSRLDPDTGEDPVPGTIGERIRQQSQLVSRGEWFEGIQDRLCELVESGVEEAFLVRSVRDAIRQRLDVVASADEDDPKRVQTRESIKRILEDPAELAAFRTRLADVDPLASSQPRSMTPLAAHC